MVRLSERLAREGKPNCILEYLKEKSKGESISEKDLKKLYDQVFNNGK